MHSRYDLHESIVDLASLLKPHWSWSTDPAC